jgi:hypothetical protein
VCPAVAGVDEELQAFVSGYTAETVQRRGKLPPGSAFIEKPFDQLSLRGAVRAARPPG